MRQEEQDPVNGQNAAGGDLSANIVSQRNDAECFQMSVGGSGPISQ